MQSLKTMNDLPKTGLVLLKSEVPLDLNSFINASFRGSKKCVIHHTSFRPWLEDFLTLKDEYEFVSFSDKNQVSVAEIKSSESKDVFFLDLDIHVELHGQLKTLHLLNEGKRIKRVFILSSYGIQMLQQSETLASAMFSIRRNGDAARFECSTIFFEKNGKVSTSVHQAFLGSDQQLVFKPFCKPDAIADRDSAHETAISKKTESSELPFFASRHEDGVALRDAATKKIRVGGQIVYEPDRDDDLDDSDPDDDLNI